MRILTRMLLRAFLPVFVVAMGFFILILQLADLFPNMWRFTEHEVGIGRIIHLSWLYVPTTLRYGLPIALLFSITYTLGRLYAHNELIAILGIGVSLRRFISPLLVVGIVSCPALLLLEEEIGARTLRTKNELFREAVNQRMSFSNADVTVRSAAGDRVFRAEYYNDRDRTLSGLLVVDRSVNGDLLSRIDAAFAEWRVDRWVLSDVRRYLWDATAERMVQEDLFELAIRGTDGPDTFRRGALDVAEMTVREGLAWVQTLRSAGLSYRSAQTDVYGKMGFALTPLIVSLLAVAAGGLIRRNVLLASMLLALGCSVGYFVLNMVCHILAKSDLLSPLFGAFLAAMVFLLIGVTLLRRAHT